VTNRTPSRRSRRPGPPPGDDVAAAIIARLRAFTTAMDRYVDVHGGRHGLHRTDLNALAHVMDASQRGSELTPGELASALNLSPPATSALLTRLESVGHVRRSHSPTDRRRVAIEMTDEARGVGREVFAPIGSAVRDVIDELAPDERQVVLRFLTRLVEVAEESGRPDGMS
jgi:DNA-binding MarR family transcriptional regulator